ncbi:MAG: acetyltransferase [Peptoanaerobacter stomatis]|uniref:acetyltransferase n=1 Tax=Peptoanaerobacter stomatis TaxID=796937 RepID=UPI003FA02901
MESLIVIGAGGYAKSILDSIDYYNYKLEGFLDEFSNKKEHLGIPIIANNLNNIEGKEEKFFFVAIGNNCNRKRWYDKLIENNLRLINIVDKTAVISPRAKIGTGCFVGKMAIINSMSSIGDNCIINTKALVEHGCSVASHVNLSTNAIINGDVKVAEGAFIGSSSVTLGQLSIGSWCTIGAGAVVTKNIDNDITVVGIPAKHIHQGVKTK